MIQSPSPDGRAVLLYFSNLLKYDYLIQHIYFFNFIKWTSRGRMIELVYIEFNDRFMVYG